MKIKDYSKGIRYFWKGLKSAKGDLWASVEVLVLATIVLGTVMQFVEHSAQPEVYAHWYDSYVWAMMGYLGNPGKFATGDPITVIGRLIAVCFAILKILIFAVPAGLVANGFRKAMEEDKREKKLNDINNRLKKAFRLVQCRYTHKRTEPQYVSVVDIEANQHIDRSDIIDAVNKSRDYRLRNIASTFGQGINSPDRLVVEHITGYGEADVRPYGCFIDRKSNITIVGPSNVSEAGIGNFAYNVAKIGSFNYISKEYHANDEDPVSFYVVEDPNDHKSYCKDFIDDVKRLSRGKDKWVIFLISASGSQEPEYPTHFHFIYGARKGDEGYTDPNLTISDPNRFDSLYQNLSSVLDSDYGYKCDRHKYHTGAGVKNIARRIGGGSETNAFTLRIAYKVTVWDDRRVAIAKEIATCIDAHLSDMACKNNN